MLFRSPLGRLGLRDLQVRQGLLVPLALLEPHPLWLVPPGQPALLDRRVILARLAPPVQPERAARLVITGCLSAHPTNQMVARQRPILLRLIIHLSEPAELAIALERSRLPMRVFITSPLKLLLRFQRAQIRLSVSGSPKTVQT